jgi:hypothetical protein
MTTPRTTADEPGPNSATADDAQTQREDAISFGEIDARAEEEKLEGDGAIADAERDPLDPEPGNGA